MYILFIHAIQQSYAKREVGKKEKRGGEGRKEKGMQLSYIQCLHRIYKSPGSDP